MELNLNNKTALLQELPKELEKQLQSLWLKKDVI